MHCVHYYFGFLMLSRWLNENCQVDLGRMVSIITTSIVWIVNIYVVQLLLMYIFTVLGKSRGFEYWPVQRYSKENQGLSPAFYVWIVNVFVPRLNLG